MEIRRADRTDLSAIVEITQRAYAIWLPDLGYPPVPVTEDYAPRIDRGEVWLACSGNKPTALIVLERAANHDMIFSVAVDPTYAGQGLGQLLIAFAEERARAAGLGEIRLYTNALMKPNIALYSRLGFHEVERKPNPKRPGFTIVGMVKDL